ncbi:phosphate ABC transporter permease PstA [Endozoicomonas sp. G2_1]|uniref:phosphate ABC transporter permease PstA n=1 Tax=Endozoicomonas sp. G2_1 TaxID=2821091 RepID=UPI001AD9F3F7|nr:phosphate ABC transporter permease PstA [Endozoicomonas sp. G2_1]MBO9490249.1 phosphate ABC transporter permease PstA [Endozoicomonas sp. G2_1]
MQSWYKSGSPWVWLSAAGVSFSLIAVLGLLWLIASRGLSYFWPAEVYQFDFTDEQGQTQSVIGEIYDREQVPYAQVAHLNLPFLSSESADSEQASGEHLTNEQQTLERILIKTGNRELTNLDFRWLFQGSIVKQSSPEHIAVIERRKNGDFYGFIDAIVSGGQVVELSQLPLLLARARNLQQQVKKLERGEIRSVNFELERLRLHERKLLMKNQLDQNTQQEINQQRAVLEQNYRAFEQSLNSVREQLMRDQIIVTAANGRQVSLDFADILQITYNNQLTTLDKVGLFLKQLAVFVSDEPREANTEGGVFPAIFGTVLMVLLMTIIVSPFGVVAAIYLHEYAGKNTFTRVIRIAVINLAGVPSIVYGVFGLGFFVYLVGGSIDNLFFGEALPAPTFGTPGVLWSAVTLAILTLPVVIVSTEEGLARIPSSLRHGSLALGATKAETLWRIILPIASPAIMTGIILAIARAAGEVAPLMLVGVVKIAPSLPLDGDFPFLHLERKFMHLGFHIYDVGFQSPNIEAARPLVYATALLLVSIIVALNVGAVAIRNRLREKYRALEQ